MIDRSIEESDIHKLLTEHAQLRDILDTVDATVFELEATTESISEKIKDLRNRLQKHFAHEEFDGYLHEALEQAPHLTEEANRLLKEHPEFLLELQEMSQWIDHSRKQWHSELKSRFRRFTERFLNHEHHENTVLQKAFDEDIGPSD
ncbi:MAG: hemerythrin domain-containing protein [Pirellulales bacterium]|jgi:predicted  nucleic acid-binding Zn-ribbon protein